MGTVRVVRGSATGPTAMAAYDAALAAANVHNYNLVTVSSVVPPDADVAAVGTAPDLGPVGGTLTVVQARATAADGRAAAALGWATGPEGGLLYEAAGAEESTDALVDRVTAGLDAALALREWPAEERGVRTAAATAGAETHAAAVVLAAYGEASSVC